MCISQQAYDDCMPTQGRVGFASLCAAMMSAPPIPSSHRRRWTRHRAALLPVTRPDLAPARALDRLLQAFAGDVAAIEAFLLAHGLSGIWDRLLATDGAPQLGAAPLVTRLSDARRGCVMLQLAQESSMRAVHLAFDRAGIEFVYLKAAATRGELYEAPGQRPANDIDVLVRAVDRDRAISALVALGGVRWAQQAPSAHEATFRLGMVDIDLHWDLLAPGRLRGDVVGELLHRRVATPLGWRPDDTDGLFVALVHLAFAKYVCSPHAGLNRVADIWLTLRRLHPDIGDLSERLHRAGAATAAWTSAAWLAMLTSPESDEATAHDREAALLHALLAATAPGRLRARYLRGWLGSDWPGRLIDGHEALIRVAFTLPLHDALTDAFRATYRRLHRRPVGALGATGRAP